MENKVPHVLLFPFPAQGHINSMINLAQLLCLAGIHVTFLNSEHNHDRLLRFTDIQSRFPWPGFRFRTISDGLPAGHPRSADLLMEVVDSLRTYTKPLFREMLIFDRQESDAAVTFIVADGIMMFAIDVADELGIPIVTFRTISACSFWSYFCIPRLVENGELPFPDDGDMDGLIKGVPGMETFLRRRDLPSFLRVKELNIPNFQFLWTETQDTTRSAGLILNTFEELESPILSQIRFHCPNIYTIGPLHALLKSKVTNNSSSSSSSLWKEDKTCMAWLDSKPPGSVIYVSFGSFATATRDEMLEFWHGLVNSQKSFLWVIRPGFVTGKDEEGQIPAELEEGTRERGFLVEWAPQEEVLAHPAVAVFFTHSGWNSTVESIFAGVPMICRPFFADQQINSRFVSEVWRVGLDMKDLSSIRETVEMMVREVMEGKREELRISANKIAEFARQSVGIGGSSWNNLERLIEDIKSMSFPLN